MVKILFMRFSEPENDLPSQYFYQQVGPVGNDTIHALVGDDERGGRPSVIVGVRRFGVDNYRSHEGEKDQGEDAFEDSSHLRK
jgi:hypothetical protein